MNYTLKPDSGGHIIVDGKNYKPGDVIFITGNPKDVLLSNVNGDPINNVHITNVPGEKLSIGDEKWSGGSYSYGLVFKRSKYVNIFPSYKGAFTLSGSTSTALDTNGFGVRGAYFNLRIDDLSDNFTVRDLVIKNGGTGLWAKTEVSPTDSRTWAGNFLENFKFYNLEISNTYVEGMYIGHTATLWNIKTNQPMYTRPTTDLANYKEPAKLRNVVIENCKVYNTGFDAIQTAAIDNLDVVGNEIYGWAANKNWGHNAGILIGGRVKNFRVFNNYIHEGYGDGIQVYAEGGADAIIKNNLVVKAGMEGVSLRGTNALAVLFERNTVIMPGSTTFRVNGAMGGTGQNIVRKNIFIQPAATGGVVYPNRYIYLENGGKVTDEDNIKIPALADVALGVDNYYEPRAGSPFVGYGYEIPKVIEDPDVDPHPTMQAQIEGGIVNLLKLLPAGNNEFTIRLGEAIIKIGINIIK
jgi:hypothetical protein